MVVASWLDGRAAHDAHCANYVCVRVAVVAPAYVQWPRLLVLILGSPQIEEGRIGPWDSPRYGLPARCPGGCGTPPLRCGLFVVPEGKSPAPRRVGRQGREGGATDCSRRPVTGSGWLILGF